MTPLQQLGFSHDSQGGPAFIGDNVVKEIKHNKGINIFNFFISKFVLMNCIVCFFKCRLFDLKIYTLGQKIYEKHYLLEIF
jgi:hypothetical protein